MINKLNRKLTHRNNFLKSIKEFTYLLCATVSKVLLLICACLKTLYLLHCQMPSFYAQQLMKKALMAVFLTWVINWLKKFINM